MLYSTVFLSAALPLATYGFFDCRPPGPIVPRPTGIASNPAFISAASGLATILQNAVSGNIESGWPVENTSFSVGFITRDQESKNIPVWEFHFLAPNNVRGTKNVTRNSQYLINSVTKVVSNYILLRSGVSLDDPITKYIPELMTNSTLIAWDTITLRALANGLADIPPSYGFFEIYAMKPYFESLGFPAVEDSSYPPCGVVGLNDACTTAQLIQGISELNPLAKPGSRPVYSNLNYFLFTQALEVATGKNYTTFLRELVTEPFGMENTKPSPGDNADAVIPPGDNLWGNPYSHHLAGSGLVSTLSDLTSFFHSILDRSVMPTETALLEWLKPSSSTGSLYNLVGMPWEISRQQDLTPNHPHTIDLYGKGGGAGGYRSQATVIDEYGVGIILLSAGSSKAANFIHNAVLKTLIPVVDQISREQATVYTGAFGSSSSSSSFINTAANSDGITLSVTQDRNSLLIDKLHSKGIDMLASYGNLFVKNIGETLDVLPTTARIYPTDISRPSVLAGPDGRNMSVIREEWRLDWELVGNTKSALPGSALAVNECWNWVTGDWVYYASESMDRIVFVRDKKTKRVVGVEVPVLRSGLLRKVVG